MPAYLQFSKPDGKGPEIVGSSQDPQHARWVELDSFQWDVSGHGHIGRRPGESSDTPHDVHFSTHDGAVFTTIFLASADGTHYPTVTLEAVSEGRVYFRMVMKDVVIASVQTGGGRPDAVPLMQFSLNAAKIEFSPIQASAAAVAPQPATTPPKIIPGVLLKRPPRGR
jgi:type VI protein secretion system component Hcp